MIVVASVIAAASGVLLAGSGYLFGIQRGTAARRELAQRGDDEHLRAAELERRLSSMSGEANVLRAEIARLAQTQKSGDDAAVRDLRAELRSLAIGIQERERAEAALRADLKTELTALAKKGTDPVQLERELRRAVLPLLEQQKDTRGLRDLVQQAVMPMLERDRIGRELAQLEGGTTLGELPRLLDAIASKGGFSSVVLSDDIGLPLAASTNASAVDWLAGMASFLLTLVERSERSNVPKPIGVVVHDESNQMTLHRIFRVGGSLFLLTAVSRGQDITPDALDPALAKLERALARPELRA